jgi:hypothetical protein
MSGSSPSSGAGTRKVRPRIAVEPYRDRIGNGQHQFSVVLDLSVEFDALVAHWVSAFAR